MTSSILCADFGATKALLGVAQCAADGQPTLAMTRRYRAADYSNAADVLSAFFQDWNQERGHPLRVQAACLGVAGPIDGAPGHEHVRMTNLPWGLVASDVAAQLRIMSGANAPDGRPIPVRLVNDFVAAAHGIDAVLPTDLLCLQSGEALVGAPQLVIGAGSGLGVAWRIWQGNRYVVIPSEGGHASFAAPNFEFDALMPALRQRFGQVAIEHVVSGPGLVNLYVLLRQQATPDRPYSDGLTRLAGEDITRLALVERDPLASKALDLFLLAFGSACSDLALSMLAQGGIYVTGGIAAQCSALMQDGQFISALINKGVYADLITKVPVHVVTQSNLPLLGAARLGVDALTQDRP